MVAAVRRRATLPLTVQKLWDAILYIRQQKQVSNLTRVAAYMRRVHGLAEEQVKLDLESSVEDGLIVLEKRMGCKGSKAGVPQEGYKLPDGDVERDDHDWYCFECHLGGEMYLCSQCHRVYHPDCLKENSKEVAKFVCPVCRILMSKNEFEHLSQKYLNQLLSYTCIRLKEKTKLLHKMPGPEVDLWRYNQLVYASLDLNEMEERVRAKNYIRMEEYLADAMTILHAIMVFYGNHCLMAGLGIQMMGDCEYDLAEIQQCNNCYRMSNDKKTKYWFCQPCDPPHDLVYAKQKGFPYWPAKVIKVEADNYDVRFFGNFHQRATIEKSMIQPITADHKEIGLKKTPAIARALDELQHHQKLLQANGHPAAITPTPPRATAGRKRRRKRDDSPSSSSSTKVAKASAKTTTSALEENNNVVSSSCPFQEVVRVSVGSQTEELPAPDCSCNTKYSKVFREMEERLVAKHKDDKEGCLKELTKKLEMEFEASKNAAVAAALAKLEQGHRKTEEQIRAAHQAELARLAEQHGLLVSETKKKQWCYNCEAEAIYHCCWNTSYCSVECQQQHWHKEHKRTCRRKR